MKNIFKAMIALSLIFGLPSLSFAAVKLIQDKWKSFKSSLEFVDKDLCKSLVGILKTEESQTELLKRLYYLQKDAIFLTNDHLKIVDSVGIFDFLCQSEDILNKQENSLPKQKKDEIITSHIPEILQAARKRNDMRLEAAILRNYPDLWLTVPLPLAGTFSLPSEPEIVPNH